MDGLTTNRAGVSDYWLRQSGRPQRKTDGRSFVCLGNSTRIGFELACAPAALLPVFFPPGAVFLGPQFTAPEALSLTRPPADALRKNPKTKPNNNSRVSVHSTVYRLQLIVPQVERDQLGLGAQAQRWRPLQAVVAQVQVLQFAKGLRDGGKKRECDVAVKGQVGAGEKNDSQP